MKVWKLASVIGGTLSLVLLLQVSPLFFSSTAISSTTEAELNQLTHINRQLKGRDLTSGQADTCVAGYEGGDISTVNPYKAPIVMDGLRPLHYCGEFNGGSCCSNIMAQEITDGFEHLMNVGGTGGVPIDDERCLQYAKKTYVALKDYFCLFCNPRQIKYLGCCNPQYKIGGNCADPAKTATNPGATTKELMTVYGQGTCIGKASDTIRVCKTFAGKLWGTDGSKYDHCGMMTWVQHRDDRVADENAWSDKDDQGVKNGNPAGFMPWGDVDGRSGDDPLTPSLNWDSVDDFFHDIRPPLFDQFRVTVVEDSEGNCFNGYMTEGGAWTLRPSNVILAMASLMYGLQLVEWL